MPYTHTLRNEVFRFADLKELFAKANEQKSGDELAGVAAGSDCERIAAKMALADLPLTEILHAPPIPSESDDVTRAILESHDEEVFKQIKHLTVGAFREFILAQTTTSEDLALLSSGITPEMAAAVCKIMSNRDLIYGAAKMRRVTRLRNTLGECGVLAVRLQPNHPTDDVIGILLSTIDGLLFGCGDAVIGVNPAAESVVNVTNILRALDRLVECFRIPTQVCCLAHFTTQIAAMQEGAPVDLLFQSIAGTTAANAAFGVELAHLEDARALVLEDHRRRGIPWVGNQVMYFETGQGSALSANAHHGVDQLTLEARAYGVARLYDPLLVNSVVGFIGPEYLFDERQIVRAGLEDHFMGKLLGLPMGCDVCYTNHCEADQNSMDNLLILLGTAGCNYVMGVPCADDVMLNYQSTSFQDAAMVRELLHLEPAPEFKAWLERNELMIGGRINKRMMELLRENFLRQIPVLTR